MQKWRFYSAIGRGRPLSASQSHTCKYIPPCQRLHTSSTQRRDAGIDTVTRDPAVPFPNRAQRQRRSTMEVEGLYHRSATGRDPTIAHQDQYTPQPNIPPRQPAALNNRDVGVPLSQKAFENQVPKPTRDSYRFERGALDARNLGGKRNPGHLTKGRSGAVDARSLGARSEPRMATTTTKETIGLELKPRFTPQQARPEYTQDTAPGNGFTRGNNNPQGPALLESDSRRSGFPSKGDPASQADSAQGGRDSRLVRENAFGERGSQARRGGAQSGRVGRPRTDRSDEGDKPRRRTRNKEGASGNDFGTKISLEETYNEEEKAYAKEKRHNEATSSMSYEPSEISLGSYSGSAPAVATGPSGMTELLNERLLLAQRQLNGEYIEWHSKEQKADVTTLVEKIKAKRRNESHASSPAEQQTQSLMQKLLGGKYAFTKPHTGTDILGNVARYVDRNESYYPMDQKSLLGMVRSLVPAETPRKAKAA